MICNVFLWLPLMILSLSFYRAVAEELSDVLDDIKNLILSGQLPRARRLVNACLLRVVGKKNEYHCPPSEDVIQTYKHYSSMLYEEESYLELIRRSMQNNGHNQSKTSSGALQSSCWDGTVSTSNAPFEFNASLSDANRWNECCSFYKTGQKKPPKCFDPTGATSQLCCYFSVGSDNHLALPILKEPYVTIRLERQNTESISNIPMQHFIEIEQEGQLSLYDVSGVLWPSGYLLGLCLNDPIACGIPEITQITQQQEFTLALELGAGVAFPSVAFAKYLASSGMNTCQDYGTCTSREQTPVIVATDTSKLSLGLIVSNTYINGVGHLVNASEINHMNIESISKLHQRYYPRGGGFDLIFGSSLQGFFDGSSNPDAVLWHSLDKLLSRSNPGALVVFSHVMTGNERIVVPVTKECDNSFEIVRRISGDIFLMSTRDGSMSDFELVVLKRRVCEDE